MPGLILVAEDEAPQRETLGLYLSRDGFRVVEAENGSQAWDLFLKYSPDLVILDLMLPDVSGERLCAKIREISQVPILMITAKVQEESVLKGFALGADDYIRKPASPREVAARVKARLKTNSDDQNSIFNDFGFSIDVNRQKAYIYGRDLNLTTLELDLLLCFLKQPGRVFTRENLIQSAWSGDFDGYDRTVDVHVKNLRKKISALGVSNPIETVYGKGYRWKKDK